MTIDELRGSLVAGTLETLAEVSPALMQDVDMVTLYGCDRCGVSYREHSHSHAGAVAYARFVEGPDSEKLVPGDHHRLHAFVTHPEVGRLVEPDGDGLVFPDGAWG